MSQYAYVSLSLIGLCALAGAGVGVGSGVAMMYSQMAQAEQEQKTTGAVAHSPGSYRRGTGPWSVGEYVLTNNKCLPVLLACAVERKNMAVSRGFAAAGAKSQ